MEHEKWFTSDTHYFHANTFAKFKGPDGVTPLRPFKNLDEMNNTMLDNCNKVVGKNDFLYHVGDVTMQYHRPFQELMWAMNGHKRLIAGNHDKLKQEGLLKHFEKVSIVGTSLHKAGVVLFHYPWNPFGTENETYQYVLHGHIHANSSNNLKCINLCVEVRDYAPVHMDTILAEIKEREYAIKHREVR